MIKSNIISITVASNSYTTQNLMSYPLQKQRVSITVDSRLLAEIDKLTENRSAAFEEALRLWYAKKIEDQLRQFYQSRNQVDIVFEEEWAQFAQEQMTEIIEVEG